MYSKRKLANKKGIKVETLLIGSAGKRKQLDWKRKLLCLFLFLCSQIPAAKIRIASLQFQLASSGDASKGPLCGKHFKIEG